MALFKIEKGLAANLAVNRPTSVEGYCYFTSDDGKFYIDIANGTAKTPAENQGELKGVTRMPINAYLSDKAKTADWAARTLADINGNEIDSHYGNSLEITDKYNLKLFAHDANHTLLSTATLPKDVDTASKFTSNQTIKLTGAVTGEKSSQAGWEIATTLSDNVVTTSKIANSAVTNAKLANSSITIGGKAVNLGGALTLADIGLNAALRFIGTTSTAITDGSTTSSIMINGSSVTPTVGDVVINSNNSQEYVWLGDNWEILGDESSYALKDHTHNYAGSSSAGGAANSANKLATARTIQTNLASTSTASFDGTANVTPGVAGILPIAHGGTGASDALSGYYNLAWRGTPTSLNDASSIGFYKINPDVTNTPYASMWGACMLLTDDAKTTGNTSGSVWQMAFTTASTDLHLRCRTNGTDWQGWHKLLTSNNYSDYCAPREHTHSYLPLAGGTMNDQAWISWPDTGNWANSNTGVTFPVQHGGLKWTGQSDWIKIFSEESASDMLDMIMQFGDDGSSALKIRHSDGTDKIKISAAGRIDASTVYGAVWNDYAEFRICKDNFKSGQVVLENGDDTLSIASQRLQRGCSIVSDTFGFAIGETDEAKCPIAVSGRVLAYGYESHEEFKKHIGWPVCSGPNGTVSIMTEEEEEKYPSRIIGTISAVPDYETWGTGNVEVNNRIWIKIK